MNTLIERTSYMLEQVGNSISELARIAGVKPPSVSDWLNGKTKSIQIEPATRLARHFGLNPMWISKGTPPMRDLSSGSTAKLVSLTDHPDLLEVPRVKFKLSAGVSGFAIDVDQGNGKPIFFRQDWFDSNGYRPEKLFAVRICGQSMEPRLWEGDLVVINTADTTPKDGEPFALNYEGELVIKRLRRDAGEWWACSDNPDQQRYAPKRCTEDVKIIGLVVYRQGERI